MVYGHQDVLHLFERDSGLDRWSNVRQVGHGAGIDGSQGGESHQDQLVGIQPAPSDRCRSHIGDGVQDGGVVGHGRTPWVVSLGLWLSTWRV